MLYKYTLASVPIHLYYTNKKASCQEKYNLQGHVSDIHLKNVKSEMNCARLRPEEVFSSVYCDNLPMSFNCSENMGAIIKKEVLSLPSS